MKRKQACSDKSGPRTCKHIEGIGWKCQTCPQFGKIITPLHIEGPESIKTLNTGFRFKRKGKDGEEKAGGPVDYQGLWRFFRRTHDYVSVKDSPDIYVFREKYWEHFTKDDAIEFAHQRINPPPVDRERREFYSFLKAANMVKKEFFDTHPAGFFNFNNGVFSLEDRSLKPHDRSYNFRHVLPCDYDEMARAPRFEQFMKEITCNRQGLEMVLQEYMGYIISGMECIFDKALLLLGEGENGKSKFIEVLRLLAGNEATAALSTKNMVSEVHRSRLLGKILNISEESSKGSFTDVEELKKMIAGGVTIGKLLFYQPFEFRNRAKFVMLCNRLPTNYDTSHGFFRRLLPVPFDAVFSNDIGNRDDRIMDKLKSELPGIFNYAIEGYERLIKNSRFTDTSEAKEMIEDYQLVSDDLRAWVAENCEVSKIDGAKTLKDSLYENYRQYCDLSGVKFPETKNRFFFELKQKLKSAGIQWKATRESDRDGIRRHYIYHVLLRADDIHMTIGPREASLWRPNGV